MTDPTRTLESLVTSNPHAAATFVRHGLDFCCLGRRTLAQACLEEHVPLERVVQELEAHGVDCPVTDAWDGRPLDLLVGHIIRTYHQPLRQELPALVALARRVEQVHGTKPDVPSGLADHLAAMHTDVESHLTKEEHILFPLILGGGGDTAYMPIKVLMEEHLDHGANLRRARALAHGFVPPADACASWRALYRGLEKLEGELWSHIHLENYVLFPRATHNAFQP
jgi:regulator of cell morphogenesis and NO signaling